MTRSAFACVLALSMAAPVFAQPRTPPSHDRNVAEAYAQFLMGRHLDDIDDEAGAVAAYKRGMEADPEAADIPAELAALYLRQNKVPDATAMAERALKVAPANAEANRVLGIIYASRLENDARDDQNRGRRGQPPASSASSADNATLAITHLERAVAGALGEADPNLRATLARLYIHEEKFDKAIPLLTDLVKQEP